MSKDVTIKLKTTTAKDIWIELHGDDVIVDYYRNYKHLEQAYHAQMTFTKGEAIMLGMNLIAILGKEIIYGSGITSGPTKSNVDTEEPGDDKGSSTRGKMPG